MILTKPENAQNNLMSCFHELVSRLSVIICSIRACVTVLANLIRKRLKKPNDVSNFVLVLFFKEAV
jgi:hypothetical protein